MTNVPGLHAKQLQVLNKATQKLGSAVNNHTETQMAAALRLTLAEERLHTAFNAVDLALASRGEGAQGLDGEGFRLKVTNAIWGQPDYPFRDEYLDVLGVNYGAGLRLLDFANRHRYTT